MARVTLSPELKKAISELPGKEKDKLLFRLIAKEEALAAQLEFKLLEGGDTTEVRREAVRHDIDRYLLAASAHFHSPGYLLLDLRSISGVITRHVKTTRDKYGEIFLNLFMLNRTFELLSVPLSRFPAHRAYTFNDYVVKRALKLLTLAGTLHEDYHLDFKADFQRLGQAFRNGKTIGEAAARHGLDINWLLSGAVPGI
jgi:hypothetical protein